MIYGNEIISGIYQIKNNVSGRRYIGSSKNILARWARHKDDIKYGVHGSIKLTRAFAKYGVEAFSFSILLRCAAKNLIFFEQRAIDILNPAYNTSKIAGRIEHTPEIRAKISAATKLAWACPERRKKQSERVKANPLKQNKAYCKDPEYVKKLRTLHRKRLAKHEAFGKLWSIKDLAEQYGVHYGMLRDRIHAGWDAERAVLTPKRKGGL